MSKTILSLILVLSIILPLLPAYAAEHETLSGTKPDFVFLNDDFGERFVGVSGDWRIMNTAGGSITRKTVDGRNAFHFEKTNGGIIQTLISLPELVDFGVTKAYFRFEIRNDDFASKEFRAGSHVLFSLDNAGFISLGGKPIAYLPIGEFHEVTIFADCDNKKTALWLDGKYMGEGLYGDTAIHKDLYISSNSNKPKSDMYISKASIYTADSYCMEEAIDARYDEISNTISKHATVAEIQERIQGTVLLGIDTVYAWDGENRIEAPKKLYENFYSVMVPVRFASELIGAKVDWTPEKTTVSKDGKRVELFCDRAQMNVDGVSKELLSPTVNTDGTLYAPLGFLEEITTVTTYDQSFVSLGESIKDRLDTHVDEKEVFFYLVYKKPTAEEILSTYKSTPNYGKHPRLVYTPESLAQIKEYAKTDSLVKGWIDTEIAKADSVLDAEPASIWIYDGLRSSSDAGRASSLAFAYMMTGDEKYGKAMWRDLEAFCDFPDLNHRRHFLDVGGLIYQIALAYDWGYYYMTPDQRAKLEHAMWLLAIDPAVRSYQGIGAFDSSYWTDIEYNWNCVCNSGIAPAALALIDSDEKYYSRVLEQVFRSIEYYLPTYRPDGGFVEGPSYWEYSTNSMVNMFSAIEPALGTLFGYYDVFNIRDTGLFPIYMQGNKIQFCFGDSYVARLVCPITYYFAIKNNDPDFASIALGLLKEYNMLETASALLPWYKPGFESDNAPELDLDKGFVRVGSGSMRQRWNDTGAAYLGYRGGTNNGGHDQLDIGSFVYDIMGERWASDLGRGNYNAPGYFSTADFQRYQYYENRAEAHNVLLVNPKGKKADQPLDAFGSIKETKSSEGSAYAIMDTLPSYDSGVSAAQRGFMLTNYRKSAYIRDELTFTGEDNDIWWFLTTPASVTLLENGKSALLSIGDKKCVMTLSCSDKSAKFAVGEAAAFDESPINQGYVLHHDDYKKLSVNVTQGAGDFWIQVNITPVETTVDEALGSIKDFAPISEWKMSDKKGIQGKTASITINGETAEGFTKYKTSYEYLAADGKLPEIEVTADEGYGVEFTDIEKFPGTAFAKIYDKKDSSNFYVVSIKCRIPPYDGIPDGYEDVKISNCTVSATPQVENGKDNMFDNDFSTRYAVEGEAYIYIDLGSPQEFDAIAASFWQGNTRINYYDIFISDDNSNWQLVENCETSGLSEDYQTVFCEGTKAQYIRIKLNGTSTGSWSSVLELRVIKKS